MTPSAVVISVASLVAEDIPLGGGLIATAIAASGVTTAMFVRSIFKAGNAQSKSQAYVMALLEKQVEEAESRWAQVTKEKREAEAKYERLLNSRDRELQRVKDERDNIRSERDDALLKLARLRSES